MKGASEESLSLLTYPLILADFFMDYSLKTVLSIGGSDPLGGAGIQADIRAISSMGCHPLSVITSVTCQNSKGVSHILPLPPQIIAGQISSILEDACPDAIKIGMCGSPEIIEEIAQFISAAPSSVFVIIDPVLSASAGGNLHNQKSSEFIWELYLSKLLPTADVITPNLPEAKKLLKIAKISKDLNSLKPQEMAISLLEVCGCKALVLKGGHGSSKKITDLMACRINNKIEIIEYSHPRINTGNLHGSGCVFSSILASCLALGFGFKEAFMETSEKMENIIRKSSGYELGFSDYGPLNINNYKF